MQDTSGGGQRKPNERGRDLEAERAAQRRLWRGFGISLCGIILLLVIVAVSLP